MSYFNQFIILLGLWFSSTVQAYDFFADALYWHATEAIDWTYANDEHVPNQSITYKTISFHFDPNFRVGVKSEKNIYSAFYYTRFYTHGSDAVFGNAISGFIGDRIANFPNGYFFQAGQMDMIIDYNMFDLDIGKSFYFGNRFNLMPILGLRGGWINQRIQANFQGAVSAVENVKNDFMGAGSKAGIEATWLLYATQHYALSLSSLFTGSYLWGHWKIKDTYIDSTPATVHIIVPGRYLGALTTQALMSFNVDYRDLSVKFGYEIMDWFNQCQFFDNGTGAHGNNLVLQGVSMRFSYSL